MLAGSAALVICGILVWFLVFNRRPEEISYIRRVTGLKIPSTARGMRFVYPREFCLAGKMFLEPETAKKFLNDNKFLLSTNFPRNAEFGIDSALFQEPKTNFYKLTGRTRANEWEFSFNADSGELWVVILFPDSSGDF